MFYVRQKLSEIEKMGFYLIYDNWDDFTFKTSFTLYYFDGNEKKVIGYTKIAYKKYRNSNRTVDYLEDKFEKLSDDFYSLGQDISFYANLNDFDESQDNNFTEKVLISLNDISYNNDLYHENIDDQVLSTSLLRDVSPLSITGQFNRVARGGVELTEFDFNFEYKAFDKNIKLDYYVNPNSVVPTNIHAIIGRNGSGKTHLIKEMLNSLKNNDSNISNFTISKNATNENLISEIFSKVMCISYSFFDTLNNVVKPSEVTIDYFFWGFKRYSSTINHLEYNNFDSEFSNSLVKCFKIKRKKNIWIQAINILNIDDEIGDSFISNLKYTNYSTNQTSESLKNRFSQLSSGHKSILSMVTKIIDIIEERTLIIIDEPETHLHPPLLSNFIKALSYILKARNGVALISTHSPLILREIPKSNCYIITRFGNEVKIERPIYETFGASLNTIMKQAFNLETDITSFYELIDKALLNKDISLKQLKEHLGDEALAYLNLVENNKYEKNNQT